jgi:hypothetical protein
MELHERYTILYIVYYEFFLLMIKRKKLIVNRIKFILV